MCLRIVHNDLPRSFRGDRFFSCCGNFTRLFQKDLHDRVRQFAIQRIFEDSYLLVHWYAVLLWQYGNSSTRKIIHPEHKHNENKCDAKYPWYPPSLPRRSLARPPSSTAKIHARPWRNVCPGAFSALPVRPSRSRGYCVLHAREIILRMRNLIFDRSFFDFRRIQLLNEHLLWILDHHWLMVFSWHFLLMYRLMDLLFSRMCCSMHDRLMCRMGTRFLRGFVMNCIIAITSMGMLFRRNNVLN